MGLIKEPCSECGSCLACGPSCSCKEVNDKPGNIVTINVDPPKPTIMYYPYPRPRR
jgi:hypothetical protein